MALTKLFKDREHCQHGTVSPHISPPLLPHSFHHQGKLSEETFDVLFPPTQTTLEIFSLLYTHMRRCLMYKCGQSDVISKDPAERAICGV